MTRALALAVALLAAVERAGDIAELGDIVVISDDTPRELDLLRGLRLMSGPCKPPRKTAGPRVKGADYLKPGTSLKRAAKRVPRPQTGLGVT